MHWTHRWWYHFFNVLAIIYIGVKGYYTNTAVLKQLSKSVLTDKKVMSNPPYKSNQYEKEAQRIKDQVSELELYLDPDLTLAQLSKSLKLPPAQVSEIINSGIGQNFNDFINSYRVARFKKIIDSGDRDHLSLLAIGQEAGFNSKATFNRVFKKMTGKSPSEYKKSLST
jgi:YesN/AraC family two-component response regulator